MRGSQQNSRPVLLEDRELPAWRGLRRQDQHAQHGARETQEMQIKTPAWLQCCVNVTPLVLVTVPGLADANTRGSRLKGVYKSLFYCEGSSVSLTLSQNKKLKATVGHGAEGEDPLQCEHGALHRPSGYTKA